MLRQRIVTAIALLVPLIAALFFLPPLALAALFAAITLVAAWEWAALSGLSSPAQRLAYAGALVLLGGLAIAVLHAHPTLIWYVLLLAALWWLWAVIELPRCGARACGLFAARAGRLLVGAVTLLPPWCAAYYLHAHDAERPGLLLFVLLLVGVADSFAYFAGHRFGRTKLAPAVSPGKTVEGLLGGLGAVLLLAALWGAALKDLGGAHLAAWLALAAVTMLFSVVGDLNESRLKRLAGAKDSGRILPGHGGVLDRIDAFTAAAPVFLLGWIVLFQAPARLP